MSEGQNSTATLTVSREPTPQDVELLHRIVLRAQQEPHANQRDTLITAYESVFKERGLDLNQDDVCFWVLLELLKPGVEGDTLYEKFESVMRNKNIEVVFDDEASTQASVYSARPEGPMRQTRSIHSSRRSNLSRQSSQDITDMEREARYPSPSQQVFDDYVNNPPVIITQAMLNAIAHDKRTLFHSFLDQYRDQQPFRNLRAMERHANSVYNFKLKYKVASHWHNLQRQVVADCARADDAYLQLIRLRTLQKTRDSARVNRIQAMDELRIRGMSLYKMAIASRETTFRRSIDTKLKRDVLQFLINSVRAKLVHNDNLTTSFAQVSTYSNLILMRNVMSAMEVTSQKLLAAHTNGTNLYKNQLEKRAFQHWGQIMQKVTEMRATAEKTRESFLMRKYFLKLRIAAQVSAARRMLLGRRYLNRWREAVRKKKMAKYHAGYLDYRRSYKMRLARRCLRNMSNKLNVLTDCEQRFGQFRTGQFDQYAHEIVVTWYKSAHFHKEQHGYAVRHADTQALKHAVSTFTDNQQHIANLTREADEFRETRLQRRLQQCLNKIKRRIFEIRRRQQDADDYRRHRPDRQMVKSHLQHWHQRTQEKRGEGPLILPPATPAQRRVDQLNRLASTTPLFAPRTSFAARLRGEVSAVSEIEEEVEDEDDNK